MAQLNPAADVGGGPAHEREHILEGREEWAVLATAGSTVIISFPDPLFLSQHFTLGMVDTLSLVSLGLCTAWYAAHPRGIR